MLITKCMSIGGAIEQIFTQPLSQVVLLYIGHTITVGAPISARNPISAQTSKPILTY
jgi:hypothetical protein